MPLESVFTVLSVRDDVIPPTLNLDNLDPEIDLDVVSGQPKYGRVDYAINNSFGFGGHNVALAFGKAWPEHGACTSTRVLRAVSPS